jgi:hypothetical protein
MAKFRTQIVTQRVDVPVGYEPLHGFAGECPHVNSRTLHKALSDAHQGGLIRAVKLVRCLGDLKTGRVFVHGDDARAFLAERYAVTEVVPDEQPTEDDTTVVLPPAPAADHGAPLRDEMASLRIEMARLRQAVADLTAAMQLRAEAEMSLVGGREVCDGEMA